MKSRTKLQPPKLDERIPRADLAETVWTMAPRRLRGTAPDRIETFDEDRAFLEQLFPRGRLRVSEDGRPILVSIRKALAGWHLFRDGPGVGVFWVGNRPALVQAAAGLERRRPEVRCGDEEGILYLVADPRLAERLPWFSRGRRNLGRRVPGKPSEPAPESRS